MHNGHVGIARQAIATLGLDRLIVVPAAVSPFKTATPPGRAYDRLALVRAAFADVPRAVVDDREIRRTKGETPASVRTLLPRLKGPETETLIVTLPETTPIAEALRFENDLRRAGLPARWWIVNQSLAKAAPQDPLLRAKAQEEAVETQRVARHTQGRYAVIAWKEDGLKQYLERI